MKITFANAQPGQRIVDDFNQRCIVMRVDRESKRIYTKRYEGRTHWDGEADWTENQFNGRPWSLLWKGSVPKPKHKKAVVDGGY